MVPWNESGVYFTQTVNLGRGVNAFTFHDVRKIDDEKKTNILVSSSGGMNIALLTGVKESQIAINRKLINF